MAMVKQISVIVKDVQNRPVPIFVKYWCYQFSAKCIEVFTLSNKFCTIQLFYQFPLTGWNEERNLTEILICT